MVARIYQYLTIISYSDNEEDYRFQSLVNKLYGLKEGITVKSYDEDLKLICANTCLCIVDKDIKKYVSYKPKTIFWIHKKKDCCLDNYGEYQYNYLGTSMVGKNLYEIGVLR